MKKGDTRLQQILEFIKDYIDCNGYPPTVREIATRFNIKSTSTVHYYIEKLKQCGMLENGKANSKRALSVSSNRSQANYIQLVGDVSAGQGILAVENIECEIPLPKDIFDGEGLFMLRVQGDSMIDAGISNGDMVVVRKQDYAEIGEIVLVFWQEKATIKRLSALTPNVVLHPENPTMTDIVIPSDQCPIVLGKVIGCIKKF